MASKARGLRSLVWEMKFPAALLTNPSSGPLAQMRSTISSTAVATRMSTAWVSTRRPGMLGHDLLGGLLQHAAAPAADHAVGAQLDELLHHDPAEARAAAGDEEALSLEQIGPEHRTAPLIALAVSSNQCRHSPPQACCAGPPG